MAAAGRQDLLKHFGPWMTAHCALHSRFTFRHLAGTLSSQRTFMVRVSYPSPQSFSDIQRLTLFTGLGLLLCSGLTMTLVPISSASMQENKPPSLPTPRYIPAGFD